MSTQSKQTNNRNSNQKGAARKATPQNGQRGQARANGAAQGTQTAARPDLEQARKLAEAKQARREAELAARAERRAQALAAEKRRKTVRSAMLGAGALLGVALIAVLYMWYQDAHPGESFASQGNAHINVGDPHVAYNSNPPTSGPHAALAAWGVHETTPPLENLVHNLEDGGVVIYYRPDLDAATVDKLKAIVSSYGAHLVLTPYDQIQEPIVATAWTRLQRFQSYDEAALRKFIDAYAGIDHHVSGQG